MRRLALPLLALLACGLVLLADAQAAPASCGAGFAASSMQQIREAVPSTPVQWKVPLPPSALAEISEDLGGEAGAGAPSAAPTRQPTRWTTAAAYTSAEKCTIPVPPLYHLYCVLLI